MGQGSDFRECVYEVLSPSWFSIGSNIISHLHQRFRFWNKKLDT